MPIPNPNKPQQNSLTMVNTMFGAMTKVRPVNWGLIIHEVVGRALPIVGRKPSFLSPLILHLYQHFDCITVEEEDMLTIAAEEVAYKFQTEVGDASLLTRKPTAEFPETQLSSASPSSPSGSRTQPKDHLAERGSLCLGFLDNPFKWVQEGLEDL